MVTAPCNSENVLDTCYIVKLLNFKEETTVFFSGGIVPVATKVAS